MLRFYLAVARATYRRQLVYRWANLAGLTTNVFFGVITSYVLVALYRARPAAGGYDLQAALRYLWLAQSLAMVTLPFSDSDLALTIRTGQVVSDLGKPCDYYGYWFSRFSGRSLYYLVFRGLPCYAAGMFFFHIGLPQGWQPWLGFALSLPLATMLCFAYRFMYNLAAFWVLEARAVVTLCSGIAQFFGGLYVPLAFFPPALRAALEWLPFGSMINTYSAAFTGHLTGAALLVALGRQALWLLTLTLAARALMVHATRRVVVQGG